MKEIILTILVVNVIIHSVVLYLQKSHDNNHILYHIIPTLLILIFMKALLR